MVDVVRENNREEIGESGIERKVMEKGGIVESKATEVMRERERERESQIESLRNLSEFLLIF